MKIVQSFWSQPMFSASKDTHEDRLNGGWPSRLYNYYSWTYSCLLLRQLYDEVELVTDDRGKALLIDRLGLPYTSVNTSLNECDRFDSSLWALGKLFAYRQQRQPFIHVDGDIYLYERFPDSLASARIVGQNIETGFDTSSVAAAFKQVPDYLSSVANGASAVTSINCGIFGGNDLEFIARYVEEALSLVEQNYHGIIEHNSGLVNCIFEQVLLYELCVLKGVETACMLPPTVNLTSEIGAFHRVPMGQYMVHLVGLKKSLYHYKSVEMRLAREFPEYFSIVKELYLAMEI